MFGQSLRLSSYPKGLNNNHNDPDFSRSNVFCWCKSTRFQCMRIILFRFQHPEPTGSYRYAVFFSPGPTFLKAHRWHSIKREDKAGKKKHAIKILSLGYPCYPWDSTIGFLDRTTDFRCVTLFASIRTSARCHCCAFSQQLMAALAKNRDMEPHDIQDGTHMAKPSNQHLNISNFGGGKPSKPGNFFQGND